MDTLLNIKGYYTMRSIRGFYPLKPNKAYYSSNNIYNRNYDYNTIKNIDTSNIYLLLYPDGTFLFNFFPSHHQENINNYFKQIIETTNKREKNIFYKAYRWGSYIVSNDTIKAQWFNIPRSLNDHWYGGEIWFKIISTNEIQEIDHPKSSELKEKAKKEGIATFKSLPAKFTPVEVLPTPDAKLKEEDWFWCKPRDLKETKSR